MSRTEPSTIELLGTVAIRARLRALAAARRQALRMKRASIDMARA